MDAISLFKRLSLYMHDDALCFAGVNQAGSGVINSRLSVSSGKSKVRKSQMGKSRVGVILHGASKFIIPRYHAIRSVEHEQACAAQEKHCEVGDTPVGLCHQLQTNWNCV